MNKISGASFCFTMFPSESLIPGTAQAPSSSMLIQINSHSSSVYPKSILSFCKDSFFPAIQSAAPKTNLLLKYMMWSMSSSKNLNSRRSCIQVSLLASPSVCLKASLFKIPSEIPTRITIIFIKPNLTYHEGDNYHPWVWHLAKNYI